MIGNGRSLGFLTTKVTTKVWRARVNSLTRIPQQTWRLSSPNAIAGANKPRHPMPDASQRRWNESDKIELGTSGIGRQ